MATKGSVVQGLFGLSPIETQRQIEQEDLQSSLLLGNQMPAGYQGYTTATSNALKKLGRGIGSIFGLEDERLTKAKDIESIIRDVNADLPSNATAGDVYSRLYDKLSAKGYTNEAMMALQKGNEAKVQQDELQIQSDYYRGLADQKRAVNYINAKKEITDILQKKRADNKSAVTKYIDQFDMMKPIGQDLKNLAETLDVNYPDLQGTALEIFNKLSGQTYTTPYGDYPLFSPQEAWSLTRQYINDPDKVIDKEGILTGNMIDMKDFDTFVEQKTIEAKQQADLTLKDAELTFGITSAVKQSVPTESVSTNTTNNVTPQPKGTPKLEDFLG